MRTVIVVLLVLIGLMLYLSYIYQAESLTRISQVFSRGFGSLGKAEDETVRCPNCNKKIKRSDSPYCSDCKIHF